MAQISNIYIDQGCDFSITIDVTDAAGNVLDMTDYTAEAQIRKTYSSSSVTSTFTTAINEVGGQVNVSLTSTQTSAIESGRYVYDVNITDPSGSTSRVVEGQAIITPGVTR